MPKRGETGSKYRKIKISSENIRQKNKKEYAKIIVLAAFLLVITIGGSYALFQTTITGNKQTEVVAGTLKVEYEDKNTISLNNASPLTDVEGLKQEPYTFTIRNIGTLNGKYTIYLEEKEGNTLDKSNIKYSIKEGDGSWSSPVLLSSGLVLKENRILEKNQEETYQIKMWLKEDATNEVQGQTYKAKVVVNVVQTNTENIVTTNPVIKLNGESVVKVNQNDLYTDAGVSSVSSREEISLDKVKVRYEYNNGTTTESVERIDTSKVGIYYIYYEVEDSKGIKGISTRVVNVIKKGTNIPTIVLKGEEEISLGYKEKYIEAGYEAKDAEDGELTDKVVVEGVVNSEVAGTYIIKYIVIDSEGATASVVRKVIVNGKSQNLTAIVNKEETENISTSLEIEAETDSDKVYYAVTTTDKKPGDSEYKELVNKRGSLNIVKNGRYYIFIKDSKGNITKKEIQVTNIDETKPSCSFAEGGYVEKGKTKEIGLTCTDPADIATAKIEQERIEVSDSEVGAVESITAGEKIDQGYKYKVTVRGKNSGNFTLKLKANSVLDKVGNKNEEVNSTNVKVVEMILGEKEIKLDLTGTNEKQIEISGTNIGKLSYESNNKEIAIVTEEGIVRAVSPGVTTITVTEANSGITTQIKVTVVKTLTAYFTKNGVGVSEIGSVREYCEVVDTTGKCEITLPGITTIDGYEVVGWGISKTATEGLKPTTKVTLTENVIYYSISGKTLTATFNKNNALSLDGSEENSIKKSCVMYNSDTSCEIDSPVVVGSTETPIVIGFSKEKDSHTSTWNQKTKGSISTNVVYYAQTKSSEKTLNANFRISSTSKITKIENEKGDSVTNTTDSLKESCTIKETFNGEAQATTCEVKSPLITVASGYSNSYWSKNIDATTGVTSGANIAITDGDIYYANAKINEYTVTYDYKTNGGTAASKTSDKVAIGSSIDLTPSATKAGYTFVGWNTSKDAKVGLTELTMGNGNITVYAIYKKEVSATFYYYDGTKQATTTASCTVYNKEASCNYTLPTVVKNSTGSESSTYKGVSDKASSTTPAADLVSTTTKYYAYYTGKWTLRYEKGTGVSAIGKTSDTCESNKITDGTSYKATTCEVTLPTITEATDYNVDGWYNASGTKVTSPYRVSKSETLTAKAKLKEYTVTYDYATNGGTSASKTSAKVAIGSSIDLTPSATKEGYTFVGWNTSKDAKVGLTELTMGKVDVTIYAIYKKEVSAAFNYYNGSAQTKVTTSCTMYNKEASCSYTVPDAVTTSYGPSTETPSQANYLGVSDKVNSDTIVSSLTSNTTTYYAVYAEDWLLKYAKGAGVASTGKTTDTCTSKKITDGTSYKATTCEVTLPTITATTGYTTEGWYNASGAKVTSPYTITKSETLTSRTNINKYTVTYDYATNGGTSATKTSATVNYGSSIDLTPTATKAGYTFVGWNTAKTATTALSSLTMGTSNVTLYAIYKDATAPKCSFGTVPTINYGTTGTISLTCTDSESGMNSQTLATSNFTISSTTVVSIEAISNPTAVTNGYTYTITLKGLAAGSFNISLNASVISDKEGNKNAKTTSGSITVAKVSATNPTLTAYTGVYDGASHTIGVSGGTGGTIEYSTDNKTWTTTKPTRTNAGTTTVYVKVTGDSNHNTTSAISTKIEISQRTTTCTSSGGSKPYDKTALTNPTGGSCTNLVSGHSATFTNTGSITNAGTTPNTISSVVIKSGTADVSGNYTITKVNGTLTVTKINATNPTLTAYTGVYDGASHTIGVSGGTGGTIEYSTDNKTWTTTKPTRTNAGTTTVYVKVTGDSNHNTTTAISSTITISKATPTLTQSATSGSATTGNTTSYTISSNVAGSYKASSSNANYATVSLSSTSAQAAGTKVTSTVKAVSVSSTAITITVTFTPNDTTNYNTVSKTYSFTPKARSYKARFYRNGATSVGGSTSDYVDVPCTTTGSSTTCSVVAPSIVRSGYTIVGYNTSSSATTSSLNVGSSLTIGSDVNYYAITYQTLTATVYYYNTTTAKAATSTAAKCNIYNTTTATTGCTANLDVTSTSGPLSSTYYGLSSSKSSSTLAYNASTKSIKLTSNPTYYAVYQGTWALKYSQGANTTISKNADSCTNYKTYNGTSYDTTYCSVTLATITPAEGYVTLGWFFNGATTASYSSGASFTFNSSNVSSYASGNTITLTSKARIAVASEVSYDNSTSGLKDSNGGNCTDVQCAIDSINRIIG